MRVVVDARRYDILLEIQPDVKKTIISPKSCGFYN